MNQEMKVVQFIKRGGGGGGLGVNQEMKVLYNL